MSWSLLRYVQIILYMFILLCTIIVVFSFKVELLHYENRLLKLRHLQAEAEMSKDRMKESNMKPSEAVVLHMDKIKKQVRKAEKLHMDLQTRIMERHVEL